MFQIKVTMANKNLKELLNIVKYIILSKMRKTIYFYQQQKITTRYQILRLEILYEGAIFKQEKRSLRKTFQIKVTMAKKNLKELLNIVKYIILSKMRKTIYFYQQQNITTRYQILRLEILYEGAIFKQEKRSLRKTFQIKVTMANKNLKELLNIVKYIILSKMRKTLYFYQKKKSAFLSLFSDLK